GNGLDLLSGHGGHHRETEAKRCNEAFALGKSALFAALIEDVGIQDGLELGGHGGKLVGIHPTFLSCIEGVWGLDGSCQKAPEFQEVNSLNPVVDSLSPYLCMLASINTPYSVIEE